MGLTGTLVGANRSGSVASPRKTELSSSPCLHNSSVRCFLPFDTLLNFNRGEGCFKTRTVLWRFPRNSTNLVLNLFLVKGTDLFTVYFIKQMCSALSTAVGC